MSKINSNQPIIPPNKQHQIQHNNKKTESKKNNFKDLLKNRLDEDNLNFSKHAQKRINARDMKVQDKDLTKLKKGVAKAEEKGGQESLIMVNDNAYIVSIDNETVITAMGEDDVNENVFTNIDSAVIMK